MPYPVAPRVNPYGRQKMRRQLIIQRSRHLQRLLVQFEQLPADWEQAQIVDPSDLEGETTREPEYWGVIYRTPVFDDQHRLVIPGQSHFEYALALREEDEAGESLFLQAASDSLPAILDVVVNDGFTQVHRYRSEGGIIDVYAAKSGAHPGTTEAEAAMTLLLYKLLTDAQQQAPYEDERLTEQERELLTGAWIAQYEFYPSQSKTGAPPLERAVSWTMPDGHMKFKITVQDITEEASMLPAFTFEGTIYLVDERRNRFISQVEPKISIAWKSKKGRAMEEAWFRQDTQEGYERNRNVKVGDPLIVIRDVWFHDQRKKDPEDGPDLPKGTMVWVKDRFDKPEEASWENWTPDDDWDVVEIVRDKEDLDVDPYRGSCVSRPSTSPHEGLVALLRASGRGQSIVG